MKRDFCIFCKSPLDGSDEHIMPQSVNGRLHSKELICHDCNSKFFGQKIDPVLKKIVDPIINILGWENARYMATEDIAGREYLTKDGQTKPVRPIKTEQVVDNKKVITINGDVKNTMKMFQKEAERLKAEGKVLAEYNFSMPENTTPFLRSPFTIDLSSDLVLLMNKIAAEFYAYCGLDYQPLEHLCKRIRAADQKIDNVIFCNQKNEVREHIPREVSHLIHLKNEKETGKVFAYIEIFNVLCCIVVLTEGYHSEDISFTYHQDALTAERFSKPIDLKMSLTEILEYPFENDRFGYLMNALLFRLRDRDFNEVMEEEFDKIKQQLEKEKSEGQLKPEDYNEKWIQQTAEVIAELTVLHFPYILEDQNDEDNDEYNYIHSNFREAIVQQFISDHQFLIGKLVKTKNATFIVKEFFQQPRVVKKDKELITVFIVLENDKTKDLSYVKVTDFISFINRALEIASRQAADK